MEHKVTKDKKYLISTKAETTVTDPESGWSRVIPANSQTVVVALSDKFTIEGDCVIRPFADATRTHLELNPSSAGGGSGEPEGDYVTLDAQGAITGGRLNTLENGYYLQHNKPTLMSWDISLPALTDGRYMFYYSQKLTNFSSDLPALTQGGSMFCNCRELVSFSGDLPALSNGVSMFSSCSKLVSFSGALPALTDGLSMFSSCSKLVSFSGALPALTNGKTMFATCTQLTSWDIPLPALTNGESMFSRCTQLTSFSSDLPALSNGVSMFLLCQLNKDSALRVLNTIPAYTSGTHKLTIGIHVDHQTDEEVTAAITAVTAKGWTITTQWNGTATSAVMTLDLDMIYVKKEQDENGEYVDSNGTRYMLDWGHMVTSPDGTPSELGYELFYALEEALTKWGLTKYEDDTISNQ